MEDLDIRALSDAEVEAMGLTPLTEAEVEALVESGDLVELA